MNNAVSEGSFWSNEGWFLNLGSFDDKLVVYSASKRLRVRPVSDGVVVGPFISLLQMQEWYEQLLQKQASFSQPADSAARLSLVPDTIEFNLPVMAAA